MPLREQGQTSELRKIKGLNQSKTFCPQPIQLPFLGWGRGSQGLWLGARRRTRLTQLSSDPRVSSARHRGGPGKSHLRMTLRGGGAGRAASVGRLPPSLLPLLLLCPRGASREGRPGQRPRTSRHALGPASGQRLPRGVLQSVRTLDFGPFSRHCENARSGPGLRGTCVRRASAPHTLHPASSTAESATSWVPSKTPVSLLDFPRSPRPVLTAGPTSPGPGLLSSGWRPRQGLGPSWPPATVACVQPAPGKLPAAHPPDRDPSSPCHPLNGAYALPRPPPHLPVAARSARVTPPSTAWARGRSRPRSTSPRAAVHLGGRREA